MSQVSPDVAGLYVRLSRKQQAGTLTLTELRSGVARLSDHLADHLLKGLTVEVNGRTYAYPEYPTSGIARVDGNGAGVLGRAIARPYVGHSPEASDGARLEFLTDYPRVVDAFAGLLRL